MEGRRWPTKARPFSGRVAMRRSNIRLSVIVFAAAGTATSQAFAQKLYWADHGTSTIRRANLDGSRAKDLVTAGLEEPVEISLDPANGKMYWLGGRPKAIHRANLDGSEAETLVTGENLRGLALDLLGGKMYWTTLTCPPGREPCSAGVQRADLSGENVETLFTSTEIDPVAIAVDGDARVLVAGNDFYSSPRLSPDGARLAWPYRAVSCQVL